MIQFDADRETTRVQSGVSGPQRVPMPMPVPVLTRQRKTISLPFRPNHYIFFENGIVFSNKTIARS